MEHVLWPNALPVTYSFKSVKLLKETQSTDPNYGNPLTGLSSLSSPSNYERGIAFLTHIHTRLMALCPGPLGQAGTRKVKPIWILLKQETVSGSGISWAICKPAPCSRQITMPAPHHLSFLQAGCHSCRPTNSVKALKALTASLRGR